MYIYLQVAAFINSECANGVGRSEIAEVFDIGKQAALEHLEKCVKRGYITKAWTWVTPRSRGWVYYPADRGSQLDGFNAYSESVSA